MGSKLKIFAALNVAGWLIAVPVLVIALATPWVSYKDWPESLLKQERDSAIALGKARERDAAARETARPARRTEDARPAGQRSAGDRGLTVAAVGETQRPGASVPQRSAGAAPGVATPNPVRRLSNQPRSNSPRGVAQSTPVALAEPVTTPPPPPQPAATQPPASEQPARERRNRGRRNGDRHPTPPPTVQATEVPQEPEEDDGESQDRGDGGWNEDRDDESDRDRHDWGSKHDDRDDDDGEENWDDDDDRWRGHGHGHGDDDDGDGDTGD